MKKQVDFDSSDDDEFDLDEEYFARTYQPLSNLPTPPPSSRDWSAAQSPRSLLEDGGLLDSALLGKVSPRRVSAVRVALTQSRLEQARQSIWSI